MSKLNSLLLFIVLLPFVLMGCEAVDVGEAAKLSVLPSPDTDVATATVPLATSTLNAILPHSTAPAVLPPTITPTEPPTPFFCSYLRGRMEEGAFFSEAMQEEIRYLVHLPPCYDKYVDKAFPVLYLFHGWPLDESHWDSLGIDELVDDWISRGLIGPFIIVMPGVDKDGRYVNSSGGDNSFEGMVIDELVPLVDGAYSTWRKPEGRAVGGISRGGVWALEIALRHQDVFGIVGAHSPALALNRPLPQYDPFLLVQEGTGEMRIYLDAGDNDWARASTIQFRDLLLELGIDVTYHLHEGGHVDELWRSALADYVSYYALNWPISFDALTSQSSD